MRISRNTFWISLIISIITLLLSIILSFVVQENKITLFICNIAENIFAGCIVLVITSLFEYFVHKKECLNNLMIEINHIQNMFNKLKFFDYRDFVSLAKYSEYYKDRFDEETIKRNYEIEKNRYIKEQENSFEECIDGYINIANQNYDLFWNLYGDICFLWDFNNKTRKKIYKEIFSFVYYDKVSKIREVVIHFIEYKNSKNGNYKANKDMLVKLQEEVFYFEEKEYLENNMIEEFNIDKTKIHVCGMGEDCVAGTYYIYGNKVTKYLEKKYNYIWQLNYMKGNKKKKVYNEVNTK